jgi:hypothetical protein
MKKVESRIGMPLTDEHLQGGRRITTKEIKLKDQTKAVPNISLTA